MVVTQKLTDKVFQRQENDQLSHAAFGTNKTNTGGVNAQLTWQFHG